MYPSALLPLLLLLLQLCGCIQGQVRSMYKNFCHQRDTVANKTVALTFDDGPHAVLTPRLLDVLRPRGIKVSFYVMGIKAAMHPAILQMAYSEGHEIANHVWDHPVLTKIKETSVMDQINRTNDVIRSAINRFPTTMRPPYGNTNRKLEKYISEAVQLPVILWSLDSLDWRHPPVDKMVSKIIKDVKPGDIILMHDIHAGSIEAVKTLVERLLDKGFTFRTVSELVRRDANYTKIKAA